MSFDLSQSITMALGFIHLHYVFWTLQKLQMKLLGHMQLKDDVILPSLI